MEETADVLRDDGLMASLRRSRDEVGADETVPLPRPSAYALEVFVRVGGPPASGKSTVAALARERYRHGRHSATPAT